MMKNRIFGILFGVVLLVSFNFMAAPAMASSNMISTTSLPGGDVGVAYTASLKAHGGTQPYQWSISAGSLPPGLALNANTGVISGIPTSTVISNFTALVTDDNGATATRELSITINPAPTITNTPPDGTLGAQYSWITGVSGGTGPYKWSYTGTLPKGLSFSPSTGEIKGKPTRAGTSSFTLKVTDKTKAVATAALSITINPPPRQR